MTDTNTLEGLAKMVSGAAMQLMTVNAVLTEMSKILIVERNTRETPATEEKKEPPAQEETTIERMLAREG